MKNFILFFCLAFSFSMAFSQFSFIPDNSAIPLSATAINSMDVASVDIDNDGDVDIVIAGEYQRNLLLFNDGTGQFAEDPAKLFPEKNTGDGFDGEDSEDIAFADFDLDGDLDVIFVSEDTNFHELLINDGSGSFSFITYEFPASLGNAVTVMDLNGDIYPDIIIGNTGQNDVYINNQDLTFTQDNSRWPSNTEGTQDFKQIDLDNDGDMDIIEGIDLGTNNALINTNGVFTEENSRLPNQSSTLETRKVVLGDIDDDNDLDIFVATVNFIGTADLKNRLYLNDGNGNFSDVTDTQLSGYISQTLDGVFLDYDYDGDLDLLTTDFQGNPTSYRAFENDGNGFFSESTSNVFSPFTYSNGVALHAGLFNADSHLDLYYGNFQETDDILFFDPNSLGLLSFENSKIQVAPNPFENRLFIQSENVNLLNSDIHIYSLDGRLLFTTTMNESFIKEINLSSLSTGIYFLTISDKDQVLQSIKLIKK